MTKILNTEQQIDELVTNSVSAAKERGYDMQNDDINVIQLFENGQAMLLSVEGTGTKRATSLKVLGEVIFLPKKNGVLDVFEEANNGKDETVE